MATRCDWLRIARGDRIVFYICWVRETGVDAISAYLKVKLVLPRSLRPIVLKRSKNAITIEVVTFKFGYFEIPLGNFEFNCRQIDNNRVQLRDYFLLTYGSNCVRARYFGDTVTPCTSLDIERPTEFFSVVLSEFCKIITV